MPLAINQLRWKLILMRFKHKYKLNVKWHLFEGQNVNDASVPVTDLSWLVKDAWCCQNN